MGNAQDSRTPVSLDLYSLEVWGLEGSGYSARLLGPVDDTWADSFALAQHTKSSASRFYVDRKKGALVFNVEAGKNLQAIVSEAQTLIDVANGRAGARVTRPPIVSEAPAAAEPAKKSSQQRLQDTRGSARVHAALMVEFRTAGSPGADPNSTGMTRDLSDDGAFIVTSRLPNVGEKLDLTLHLESRNRVDLTGEVVRVLDRNAAFQMRLKAGFGVRVSDPTGKFLQHVASRAQG